MNDGNNTQMLSDPNRTQLGAPPVSDPNKTLLGVAPTTLNATVTIKPTQCPVCKTFNPAGVMFCTDCGLIFDRALPADVFGAPVVQLPMLVESTGKESPLRPGQTVVGRDGDIVVADSRCSRRHAQITNEGGVLTLEDLGSTNGTKLNGEPLAAGSKATLKSGDAISLGGVDLKVAFPGEAGGMVTQAIGSNKTAAMAAAPRIEAPPAKLVGSGMEFALKAGVNTFGRKPHNDVQIVDPYVSGSHGVIEVADNELFVTDTGSTNGTMLNDAKLAPNMRTRMTEDDVIRLGSLEFKVEVTKDA